MFKLTEENYLLYFGIFISSGALLLTDFIQGGRLYNTPGLLAWIAIGPFTITGKALFVDDLPKWLSGSNPDPTPGNRQEENMKQDENAVSPVIGVILMVAITVVLATIVFVLVNQLANPSDTPPQIAFEKESDYLRVIQAPVDLVWEDFVVAGCNNIPTGTLDAGDKIEECTGEVTITHSPTNALIYSTAF